MGYLFPGPPTFGERILWVLTALIPLGASLGTMLLWDMWWGNKP